MNLTDNTTAEANSSYAIKLKNKIYSSLIINLKNDTAVNTSDLTRHLLLSSFLPSSINDREDPDLLCTGISQEDVLRFSRDTIHQVQLDEQDQQQLSAELDSIASAMLEHLVVDDDQEMVDLDAEQKMNRLFNAIATVRSEIASSETEITNIYRELAQVLETANKHTLSLRDDLANILSQTPKELHTKQALAHDLLAARIETALIKLTLMRARAERQLYDHKSEAPPYKTISQCLVTARKTLEKQESAMKAEERSLSKQLQEYEQLLAFMGTGGGYQQVIEDWSRVKQETEECKKDLRRLGWTE